MNTGVRLEERGGDKETDREGERKKAGERERERERKREREVDEKRWKERETMGTVGRGEWMLLGCRLFWIFRCGLEAAHPNRMHMFWITHTECTAHRHTHTHTHNALSSLSFSVFPLDSSASAAFSGYSNPFLTLHSL